MGQGRINSSALPSTLAFNKLNLLLLSRKVSSLTLCRNNPKNIHLREVLKVKEGQIVDLAVRNGPRGKGKVAVMANESIKLKIEWFSKHPNDLYPVSLIVGISRPQTCRKILDQATALGVSSYSFFHADKSEASYEQSNLWKSKEWINRIERGVEQAFASYIPNCQRFSSLEEALFKEIKSEGQKFIALDNYESNQPLSVDSLVPSSKITLCVGPERGWSNKERQLLYAHRYEFRHLGPRVLRVETAVVAALGVVASNFWKKSSKAA